MNQIVLAVTTGNINSGAPTKYGQSAQSIPRITIHGNPGIIQPQAVPGRPSTPAPPFGQPHPVQTVPEPSVTLALLVLVITIAFRSLGSRKANV